MDRFRKHVPAEKERKMGRKLKPTSCALEGLPLLLTAANLPDAVSAL